MRLFIAVDVNPEIKKQAVSIQKQIKSFRNIKPVPKKNLHITLKFLGDVENPESIAERLEKVDFEGFEIETDQLGFFPNKEYISVIWLGFRNYKPLAELKEKIDRELPECRDDKPFRSHLTIARTRFVSKEEKELLLKISEKDLPKQKTSVCSFKLMKSMLTEKGPDYSVIKEFRAKVL